MIHLDQLEFLPIFPYSELLIWMLPVPNVTDHSYFDSVYLKIFKALSFLANLRLLSFTNVLEMWGFFFFFFFFDVKKNPQICNTWIYGKLDPTWVRQTRSSALDGA